MDENLKNLRLETVKLSMVLANVKAIVAEIKGLEEIKALPVARLEEAHRTLSRFTKEYESYSRKKYAEKRV